MQHGAERPFRARLCLLRVDARTGFTVTAMPPFRQLACDLVEKRGFSAYQSKVDLAMGSVAFWTQPIASAIDFMRAGFRTAMRGGI